MYNQIRSARQGWSISTYGDNGKSKGIGKDGDLLFCWLWSKENVSHPVCQSKINKIYNN